MTGSGLHTVSKETCWEAVRLQQVTWRVIEATERGTTNEAAREG